jgi:peptidoglycan/xylan/chitin deacetylase (PgdA/CDA1 family)
MAYLTRRTFLGVCALGAVATSIPTVAAGASPQAPISTARVPAPEVLTRLPGDGNQLAFTVDDGCSTADVAALGRFCADTGMRLTFFVNGINPSWTDNAALLQPMVASGQIQLGNHTWSHPHITTISPAA